MSNPPIQRHRWSRAEYERMIAAGIFHPEARLELIEGEILNRTPQGSELATVACLVEDSLRAVFPTGYDVRVQMPLTLDDSSEPEPDVAVVRGSPRDYRDEHPATAVLVVEVADRTLAYDRDRKKRIYARSGIVEYWIVNLIDRCLEVYRKPNGDEYVGGCTRGYTDFVTPRAASDTLIPLRDLQL